MDAPRESAKRGWIAALRDFASERTAPTERCELCGLELGAAHEHLLEVQARRLLCACTACAVLFSNTEQRFRRVPRQARRLRDFALSDEQWAALRIPINLAFVVRGVQGEVRALYPGPAGATESSLDPTEWDGLMHANPQLAGWEPEIEALLVNRTQGAREYYRAPIDRCYALVGRVRSHWHGMGGGDSVREAIGEFFAELRAETATRSRRGSRDIVPARREATQ